MKLLPIPRTRITTQPLNSGVVMRSWSRCECSFRNQRLTFCMAVSGYRGPAATPCGAASAISFRSAGVSWIDAAPAFSSR